MKVCNGCKIEKPLTEFGIRTYPNRKVPRSQCKKCECEYAKRVRKQRPDDVRKRNQKYTSKNKEKVKHWNRNHCNQNKERIRERANKNYKIYRQNPETVILHNCRGRIYKLIKNKSDKTENLIGCSPNFLRKWLEWQFNSRMSWNNYGKYWHIEHVKPCSSFRFPDEQYECFNWSNLKPLEASKNMSKNNQIIPFQIVLQELKVYHYKSLKL